MLKKKVMKSKPMVAVKPEVEEKKEEVIVEKPKVVEQPKVKKFLAIADINPQIRLGDEVSESMVNDWKNRKVRWDLLVKEVYC